MTRPRASAWQMLRAASKFSVLHFFPLLRSAYPLLLVLFFFETLTDQYFEFLSDTLTRGGTEPGFLVFGTAFLELLSGLLFSALWFIAVVPRIEVLLMSEEERGQKRATARFSLQLMHFLNSLVIEEVRVFAAVLCRLPFLILPALAEYVRLTLVPYVVLLDDRYDAGQVDALERSRSLAKGRWLLLSAALLMTFLVPWVAKDLLQGDSRLSLWEYPYRGIGTLLFTFFWNTGAALVWFELYRLLVTNSLPITGQEPAHADL